MGEEFVGAGRWGGGGGPAWGRRVGERLGQGASISLFIYLAISHGLFPVDLFPHYPKAEVEIKREGGPPKKASERQTRNGSALFSTCGTEHKRRPRQQLVHQWQRRQGLAPKACSQ